MPPRLFLDACALAKRYLTETGSDTMQAIVGAAEFRGRLFVAEQIEGEVLSTLNNNLRRGVLRPHGLRDARREFYTHYPAIFAVVPPLDVITSDALAILQRYPSSRIHYPDALHLAAARYVAEWLPAPDLMLVSSDGPMLHVAGRLLIPTFNPETDPLSKLG